VTTARALWRLARPGLLPSVALIVLGGYGFAHWNRALPLTGLPALLWTLSAWMWLQAGTLWLNAAVDRDEGPVLYGEPTVLPDHLERWAALAFGIALLLVVPTGWVQRVATVCCVAMSVAYSHPATLLKGQPVAGPCVNLVGYGLLSPLVGWACVGVPMDLRTGWALVVSMLAVGGAYYAAQAFQSTEDRSRGYRTLAATHGPRFTLQVATGLFGLSWALVIGLAVVGWFPRVLVICLPVWFWVQHWLVHWWRVSDGGTERHARELGRRLGWLYLFAFCLVLGEYVKESALGEPVAGMGTAAGHPGTETSKKAWWVPDDRW